MTRHSPFRTPHASFLKLEQRLVLLAWLNGHFGYERNRDLLADMKETAEDGFSGFLKRKNVMPCQY
ncbi:MAG: hypothetical protein KJ823_11090 [Proteobacteria bacterium]|nr:hypothetical protein [Pseudomonadota bacterium]